MSIEASDYGSLPNGTRAQLFTLRNSNGLCAKITNYGGIIVELHVPDRAGVSADIVLGKDSLEDYLAGHPNFGCITGRVAGRIGGACFELEGQHYPLQANNGPNCLHGGPNGYDSVLWDATIIDADGGQQLCLRYCDPDGNNGFPGQVDVSVTYALLESNALQITYSATTTGTTPFNITNHSYFNLRGAGQGDIRGHQIKICADSVATVDADSTLIGRYDPVVAGFNDFRESVTLSERELVVGNADIHYRLDGGRSTEERLAACVYEPESGRQMEVHTTEPGVQFYAGLALNEDGKRGAHYGPLCGLALETQDYADSVHYPELGGAILQPGEVFESTTRYAFSTR